MSYKLNDSILLDKIKGHYGLKESIGKWPNNIELTVNDGILIFNSERFQKAQCLYLKNRFFCFHDTIFNFDKIESGEFSISKNIEGKATYTKVD